MAARISLGSGAAALGAALGGGGSLRQQAFNQRQRQLAQMFVDAARGQNLQADTALKQHRYDSQAGLGDAFAAAYGVSPEVGNALATIATSASTSNPEQIAGIGMRREAADTENPVAANRILSALAGKPNDLTKVSGGMAFNPNVLPEKNLFTPVEPLKSGYVFDPNTQTASPVPIVGAGETSGARTVPGADSHNVTFDFAPGTPQSVIDAAYAAAADNGDIAPDVGPQAAPATPTGKTLADVAAPKAQASNKTPSGYQWNADHTGLEPIPGGPADKDRDYQGSASAAVFGDPNLSGEQYIQSIPEGNKGIVKGLLNGTVALPSGSALKSPLWQSALASVKHADPSWNQAAYKQYANARKFFTIGQGGNLINSINTAAQHLDKLREDIEAMHNGDNRYLAAAGNYLGSHFGGDEAPTNFMGDLTPVASELAAVYKGKGVPSDAEIAHFQNALSQNMSYGQQMNVIRGWIDLLAGKLNATRNQYQQSMTKLSDPLDVINPRAADALQRITRLANDVSNTGQHPMPGMDDTPINAPGGDASIPQPTAAAQPPASGGDDVDSILQGLGVQ